MAASNRHSMLHDVLFAVAVCGVCSVLVSGSAVLLSDRHQYNLELYRERRVLAVANVAAGEDLTQASDVRRVFRDYIQARTLELETGRYVTNAPDGATDPVRVARERSLRRPAPENRAGVLHVPRFVRTYRVTHGGALERVILPVHGVGLWSTLRGYLALAADGTTVLGITFYEHAETPGLGAEIDDPRWLALWEGRRAVDDEGNVQLRVIKGPAGPPAADPFRVDGISGATLTGNGVNYLLEFWLGPDGYGPFLARLRSKGADS